MIFGTNCVPLHQILDTMKRLLIFSFLLVAAYVTAQEPSENSETSLLTWHTNLDKAQSIAQKEKKPILIFFTGSDWCAPCIGLKKDFFETEEFAKRAEGMVLVMIDYPRRRDILSAEQLAYNKTIVGKFNKAKTFPKVVMLNSKAKEIGMLGGYSSYNTYKDTSHHFAFVDKQLSNF